MPKETLKQFIIRAKETLDSFETSSAENLQQFKSDVSAVVAGAKAGSERELAKLSKVIADLETKRDELEALKSEAEDFHSEIEANKDAVDKVAAVSEQASTTLEKNKLAFKEFKDEYTVDLKKLRDETKKQLQEIDEDIRISKDKAKGFLNIAADASLAHTYFLRKWGSLTIAWIWIAILLGTIGTTIYFAGFSPDFGYKAAMQMMVELDKTGSITALKMLELVLFRLPVFGPAIWLIIISSNRSALYSRLADDYAYKQSVSTVFEGHRRLLEKIEVIEIDPATKAPTKRKAEEILIRQTLETLHKDPERIHEVFKAQKTPMDETLERVEKILSTMQNAGGQGAAGESASKWAIAGTSVGTAALLLLLGIAAKMFFGAELPVN
jgi:uncharacterized protein YhaN